MSTIIQGVGKDAPVVTLECGVQQSAIPARMELIDPLAIIDLGKVLMEGAAKYGESKRGEGWYKIPTANHLNKALIHIYAYLAGDTSDDHLGHAQCRVHMALATHLAGGPDREEELINPDQLETGVDYVL